MYNVYRDGKKLFTGTYNECFGFILGNQSQSVDWALKYEGYVIEKIESEVK